MHAGKLKYPVEVYHRVEKQDVSGELREIWEKTADTRASILWNAGQRAVENGALNIPKTISLITRSYVDIGDDTKLRIQGSWYRVTSWHDDLTYRDKVIEAELTEEQ
jgi:head-tail adaptor